MGMSPPGHDERGASGQLVELLAKRPELRTPEDVFEISNGMFCASFIRQLDVTARLVQQIRSGTLLIA